MNKINFLRFPYMDDCTCIKTRGGRIITAQYAVNRMKVREPFLNFIQVLLFFCD